MSRKFDSGAQKKKLRKKEREQFQNKLPKLTEYFSSNQSNSQLKEQYIQNVNYGNENKNYQNYPTCNENKARNENIANEKNLNVQLHTEDTCQKSNEVIYDRNDIEDNVCVNEEEASHTNETEGSLIITTETNADIYIFRIN